MVSGEIAAHHAKLTDTVLSASDTLDLASKPIVESSGASKRGDEVSTANKETSGKPFLMILVPEKDYETVNHAG